MSWILVLYFNCGVGCADTASVTVPRVYATQQQCTDAGNVWLRANPTRTVASFACNNGTPPKVYRVHPEQYQE
jgi:hypothetical protein